MMSFGLNMESSSGKTVRAARSLAIVALGDSELRLLIISENLLAF